MWLVLPCPPLAAVERADPPPQGRKPTRRRRGTGRPVPPWARRSSRPTHGPARDPGPRGVPVPGEGVRTRPRRKGAIGPLQPTHSPRTDASAPRGSCAGIISGRAVPPPAPHRQRGYRRRPPPPLVVLRLAADGAARRGRSRPVALRRHRPRRAEGAGGHRHPRGPDLVRLALPALGHHQLRG